MTIRVLSDREGREELRRKRGRQEKERREVSESQDGALYREFKSMVPDGDFVVECVVWVHRLPAIPGVPRPSGLRPRPPKINKKSVFNVFVKYFTNVSFVEYSRI